MNEKVYHTILVFMVSLAGVALGLSLALAQSGRGGAPAGASPSTSATSPAVSEDGGRVQITRRTCADLVAHVPSAGAAYRPGVDVHGRPVAPADLSRLPKILPPDEIIVEIDLRLADRLGLPARPGQYDGEVPLALVTVADGRVFYNGVPLADDQQAAIDRACQEAGFR